MDSEGSDVSARLLLAELVHQALARTAVSTTDLTESYLAGLLADFLRSEPDRLGQTFGVEWLRAASLPPMERYRRLKDIADTTLFLSGVFADYVEGTLTGADYFSQLGSRAYLDLGDLGNNERDAFSETYHDLGRRFEDFAAVLAVVADRNLFPANDRVLGIYRSWLESGSKRTARRLYHLGVIPQRPSNRQN
ncbi:MAG TPA: hypothetical protein VEC57_01420 [Candidatus Limnocylindrales bacterium]|nr:hypothetical protein [Candidatus Limnocylindrales bacterium]